MSDIEESEANDGNNSYSIARKQYKSEILLEKKRKERQKYSTIWSKFTILNHERSIASCNVCGQKLSFKTTVSNLKKHVIRKHNYNTSTYSHTPYQPKITTKRPNYTDLGGLEGLVLNVVADEGEEDLQVEEQEVEASVVYQDKDCHDYCVVAEEVEGHGLEQTSDETPGTIHHQRFIVQEKVKQPHQSSNASTRPLSSTNISDKSERLKRNRIMDLQLECLEIKKYNMQMEALVLEHQLSLPRSIFTQPLQNADTVSRSTQTDVGGNNIKVLYVSNNRLRREGSHHIISFQDIEDD